MDIFSSETLKNLSELTRTLTTVLQRHLRRFAADPFTCIGNLCLKIRRIAVGPPQVLNGEPLNVYFESKQFYEAGREGVRRESRNYAKSFQQQSTRFVMCEISLIKMCPQPDRLYKLGVCYHNPDGSSVLGVPQ